MRGSLCPPAFHPRGCRFGKQALTRPPMLRCKALLLRLSSTAFCWRESTRPPGPGVVSPAPGAECTKLDLRTTPQDNQKLLFAHLAAMPGLLHRFLLVR